jgi:hypothetical protein
MSININRALSIFWTEKKEKTFSTNVISRQSHCVVSYIYDNVIRKLKIIAFFCYKIWKHNKNKLDYS